MAYIFFLQLMLPIQIQPWSIVTTCLVYQYFLVHTMPHRDCCHSDPVIPVNTRLTGSGAGSHRVNLYTRHFKLSLPPSPVVSRHEATLLPLNHQPSKPLVSRPFKLNLDEISKIICPMRLPSAEHTQVQHHHICKCRALFRQIINRGYREPSLA